MIPVRPAPSAKNIQQRNRCLYFAILVVLLLSVAPMLFSINQPQSRLFGLPFFTVWFSVSFASYALLIVVGYLAVFRYWRDEAAGYGE